METAAVIEQLITRIESEIPAYMIDPNDASISKGNVAICIIEENGMIHGRVYGTDKIISRRSYQLAWTKASQVWITGLKTGEFEQKIFANELSEEDFGIGMPDMIGWEGGQPIQLKNGSSLAIGFSGFRGVNDLDIVEKIVSAIENDM